MSFEAVFIEWVDATSCDAWTELDEAQKHIAHTIFTCGFLIDENEDQFIVALSFDTDGDSVSNFLAIPKAWINFIKYLN